MILSTPSYIMAGTYLENIKQIAEISEIGSVELLFFMYNDETERLIKNELPGIRDFTKRFNFTVHMPDELNIGHRRIIDFTRDIADMYIIHPPPREHERFLRIISDWFDVYGDIFLLENLIDREFDELLSDEPRFDICFDTGHLLLRGGSPLDFVREYGGRIREVHLHGISEGRDHNPLSGKEGWVQSFITYLNDFNGICNIEIFEENGVRETINVLKRSGML